MTLMQCCDRCGRNMPPQCLYCAFCGTRLPHPLAGGGLVAQRFQVQRTLSVEGRHLPTFLAQEKQSGQAVVLKELRDDLRQTPEAKAEFQAEVQALRKLAVPGVPRVLAMAPHEGRHYLVLEHMPGMTLRAILQKQQRLPVEQATMVLKAVLKVLESLHSQFPPLLHLDVTPDNILLNGWDKAVLLDGAWLRGLGNPFPHRAPLYSQAYAAPEVMRGQAIPASDLYSLGVTMLEAILGVPADGLFDGIANRLNWQPLPNPVLNGVLTRMVEGPLTQRFSSAEQALQALESGTLPAKPAAGQPAAPQSQPRAGYGGPLLQPPPQHQHTPSQPQPAAPQPAAAPQPPKAPPRPSAPPPPPPPPEPEAPKAPAPRRPLPTKLAQNVDEVSAEEGLESLMALYEAQNS